MSNDNTLDRNNNSSRATELIYPYDCYVPIKINKFLFK